MSDNLIQSPLNNVLTPPNCIEVIAIRQTDDTARIETGDRCMIFHQLRVRESSGHLNVLLENFPENFLSNPESPAPPHMDHPETKPHPGTATPLAPDLGKGGTKLSEKLTGGQGKTKLIV